MSEFAAFAIRGSSAEKLYADPVRCAAYIENLRKKNAKPFQLPPFPYRAKTEIRTEDGVEVLLFNRGRTGAGLLPVPQRDRPAAALADDPALPMAGREHGHALCAEDRQGGPQPAIRHFENRRAKLGRDARRSRLPRQPHLQGFDESTPMTVYFCICKTCSPTTTSSKINTKRPERSLTTANMGA